MTTERLCCVCPSRGRDRPNHYDQPQVCGDCRSWLTGIVWQIKQLWWRLIDDRPDRDSPWTVLQNRDGQWVTEPGHDPVADQLPTNANGAHVGSDQVSGSREAQAPVNLDHVDLSARLTGLQLTTQGKTWWMDQTGHLSVVMVLDLIAREWAEHLGHLLPAPTVPTLVDWLATRVDWACDQYPGIDADATELRQLCATLRATLGEVEPRPERMGAPCPSCDLVTLVRHPGEDKVECADVDCRRVLTADEYLNWSRLMAADVRAKQSRVTSDGV